VLRAVDGSSEQRYQKLRETGIDIAYREGNLRVSAHLFNQPAEIDRTLAALHADGPG
jgi:selenocysteine lyase/cysteine desulfurase